MERKSEEKQRVRFALNITEQEISETLAIKEIKQDKKEGNSSNLFGTICSGWWSNNWSE